MDQDPMSMAQQQLLPQHDPHDDTIGGIEGSLNLANDHHTGHDRLHGQSRSLDGITRSGNEEAFADPQSAAPNSGHATPPTPSKPQQSHSRPPSRPPSVLSQNAGERHHSDRVNNSNGNGSSNNNGPSTNLNNGPSTNLNNGPSSNTMNGVTGAAGVSGVNGLPSTEQNGRSHVVIKVGMVGDAQIGKTSLMVKYVEGSWDEDYIQTLGVNFMEKTISIRNTEITFSIWDLGGQREFVNMLPLVCNDAVAILFMFDLTRKSTLNSIKEWYRQGRGFNKTAIPILVGTKYDHFVNFPREDQEEISNQARRFAKAMRAALIFSSTSHSINVQKIFKIVLSKAFDLKCTIPEIENIGEPLLLYQSC